MSPYHFSEKSGIEEGKYFTQLVNSAPYKVEIQMTVYRDKLF